MKNEKEILEEIVDDLGEYLPSSKKIFYHRTFNCNLIMENMDKFKTQFIHPKEDSAVIRLLIDNNIDDKLDNKLENIDSMNREIIKNNLILGNDNSVDLYIILIEIEKEELDEKKDKLLNSFCTHNIKCKKEDDEIFISSICRNEAEVYIVLKAMRDNNIKFKRFLITAYDNTEVTKHKITSVTGYLDEGDKTLILANYERRLLNITISINSIKPTAGEKNRVYSTYELVHRPATYFIEEYNLDTKSLYFIRLSFTLYQLAQESYTKYCKLYAYILLNIEDERVKKLIEIISSNGDSLEKSRNVFKCVEELELRKEDDSHIMNSISDRVSELIKEEKHDILNSIMDIIDSTFIGYTSSNIFEDIKKIFN